MADTVADFILERLREWSIHRFYGYPGDGVNGIFGAMDRARQHLDFISVRHEESAAFMACAHAKYTGIEKGVAGWWRTLEARAMNTAHPLNPQRLFWELSSRLPADVILTCDSGSAANWYARDIKIKRGMKASLSGTLATMGPAVPYAFAAKTAFPNRPVIALVGDGAMQMNGLNGLLTIASHWRKWADPRLVVLVLHNGDLNQVTWEMRVLNGNPKFVASQEVPDFPYAGYAEMLGLRGIVADHPDRVGAVWDEALSATRPVVIDAHTDPNVPPLPAHITLKQAKNFTSAIVKGDIDALGIIRASLNEEWDELVPHGHD